MDLLEKIGHSLIQHGKFNNRIYLLKFDPRDKKGLLSELDELANKNAYSKIIAKVPATVQPMFLLDGYVQEAYIPGFYKGLEGTFFMAKYFDPVRSQVPTAQLSGLPGLLNSPSVVDGELLPKQFSLEIMQPGQSEEMANVYQQVFKTYPFPILDPSYIEKTMAEGNVMYFGIRNNGRLVGLSSAEMDVSNKNAEMTDFAVLPEFRGKKLASFLLKSMEDKMNEMNFKTLYTIARLNSRGMSKTFINNQYHYAGLLVNNTNISGQIESMNVFFKNITI